MAASPWVSQTGATGLATLPRRFSSMVAVGDSITAAGLSGQNDLPNGVIGKLNGKNWLMWASLLSGGKLVYSGSLGTGGYTSAQVLATHIPAAIASRASIVVILMGTNDIGSLTMAQTRANMLAACQKVEATGKIPVICTLTPRNDILGTQQITQINLAYQRLAQDHGWPLVDFYSALLDPATGGWTSGYNSDNVHQSTLGAKMMGQQISTILLNAGFGTVPYQHVTSPQGLSLLTNPLMTDSNADGVPDDYATPTGSATNACASGSAGEIGKVWTVTRAGADGDWYQNNAMSVVAGHRILLSCKVGSVVKSAGGAINLRMATNDGVSIPFSLDSDWTEDIPAGSLLNVTTNVPAGVTQLTFRGSVQVATGSKLSLSQVFPCDLDANGL